ncbi:hypothetical protein PanWU01x14_268270 [Parasponia andersonii]|uniref:Uncharacterized protein n=1 Tax=Parasponia andersonii TaxID=3476 RepID=A0A2P5B6B6_PARAD|nr:hypothetical protein PanWU01x14_268270 [Parasponia andersonii]
MWVRKWKILPLVLPERALVLHQHIQVGHVDFWQIGWPLFLFGLWKIISNMERGFLYLGYAFKVNGPLQETNIM